MKENKNDLSAMRYIVIGLGIMAIGVAISEGVNLFKMTSVSYLVNWLSYLIGFCLLLWAALKVRAVRKEFSRVFVLACVGLIVMAFALIVAALGYGAFGIIAFIDIKAVFMKYIADIMMLGIYYFTLLGIYQLMAKNKIKNQYNRNIKNIKIAMVIVIVTMVFIPFAHAFSGAVKIVMGAVAISVNFIAKGYMLRLISAGERTLEN